MALITVSGTLKDPSGAATAGSVTFQLANYGANIPRVIGTNSVVATFISFTANASGAWTGSIQGNDSIDPGAANTPPTTFYEVSFKDVAGNTIATLPFNFTGAGPANLDSQAPLNVVPSPTTPPNNAALLAANQTFTGNNTFQGTTTLGTVAGNVAFTGNPTVAGTLNVTGVLEAQAGISVDGTHVEIIPPTNSTLMDLATVQTVTANKTYNSGNLIATSPVINGTPSGTGVQTMTLKKGSGAGNYTNTNTSYADVDATNLAFTVTIPTGWKLFINTTGECQIATAADSMSVSLFDSATLLEQFVTLSAINTSIPYAMNWVIAGDGNSHTLKLQAKTNSAAHAWQIINTSATRLPAMSFLLTPSN